MKWVSYTRSISSRIGEENPSNTIAEQNERIARYLKKLGCNVSEKYSDRKRTAEATEGFDKLVQDGMARKFDAGLLQYRKRANEIVAHLMAKDDERTAVYREYEQGSISLEQVEEYEHQYQVAVQKQEAAFKKVMLAVNDIEKAFSHGNPWLMKFRAISIPEKLERTHLKEWLDHVWIVDFEQVEVILEESEWKRFFPEEWLNNGEEDCNGKKE